MVWAELTLLRAELTLVWAEHVNIVGGKRDEFYLK